MYRDAFAKVQSEAPKLPSIKSLMAELTTKAASLPLKITGLTNVQRLRVVSEVARAAVSNTRIPYSSLVERPDISFFITKKLKAAIQRHGFEKLSMEAPPIQRSHSIARADSQLRREIAQLQLELMRHEEWVVVVDNSMF